MEDDIVAMGELTFLQGSAACPEQYEVFRLPQPPVQASEIPAATPLLADVRLRHGRLTAHAYVEAGKPPVLIYEARTQGDGCFEDAEERDRHLAAIAEAVRAALGLSRT